ncbi:hypothetical protein [Nonomuraea sp. NEAU-A123]|uniref:hypothetical protein n=1 Tax=Nonomuraea sp. NEAU-A123 TaxID=2839649 RepID=UPI001BE457AB|nr:hypothetical protein [Nonomuraea sp. NEAU-A123]MBT2234840.1 hypothetical protein [Nonomuraea sp. NEAU-A123]
MRGRPVEVLIPAGFVCAVGGCVMAAMTVSQTTARVIPVAVAVGLFAFWARHYLAAFATGAMAWCFVTGFLVRAEGELAFGPDDLVRLAALAAVALAGCAYGQMLHVRRSRRRLRRLMRARADARRAPVLRGRLHAR